MNCIIISIGDELLIGQTTNTNAGWMGSKLNKIGIEVNEVLTISDKYDAIREALDYASTKASIVLLTGGLGPTKDDITKNVFTDYFNVPLVENKEALEHVENFFNRYNRPMLPINRLQALIPAGSKMLLNKVGTAPGMWMERNKVIFVSMPGVPYEMKYLMEHEVFPKIIERYNLPAIVHKTMMTLGLGESYIAEEIKDIENSLPQNIKIAYLPSPGLVKLRLTAKGQNKLELQIAIEKIFDKIEEKISAEVYAREDVAVEEILGKKLLDKGYTVSTAESCTTGALAYRIASVSGASKYFVGSIVAYSNNVKKNILGVTEESLSSAGAVSQETVEQMALGVKKLFNTDYAIATSGISGPTGGTEEKPIGTVWIAIAYPDGVVSEKYQMGKIRDRVVKKTVLVALGKILSLLK